MRVFIVAEPGSTHEGNLSNMEQCGVDAVEAGADSIKFQWLSNAHELARRRRAPEYAAAYLKIEFPLQYFEVLKRLCDDSGIKLGSTVYLPEDADHVAPFCNFLKIASFDANDMELIQEVAKCQKPTYISTGMRSERDIISLRGKIRSCITNFDPYFMYCISSYPAPIDQMNLHLLRQHWFYGLSDHSRHLLTGAVAVGCGARVIETHVRLNNTPKHNADYDVSFTPEEFKTYVNNIRDAEAMYGNLLQAREVQLCEHVMKKYVIK